MSIIGLYRHLDKYKNMGDDILLNSDLVIDKEKYFEIEVKYFIELTQIIPVKINEIITEILPILSNEENPLFDFIIETYKKFTNEKIKSIVSFSTKNYPQRDYVIELLINGGLLKES